MCIYAYICMHMCMYANINICDQVKWDEFQVMWDESHPHALKVAIGKARDMQGEGAVQEE